MVHYFFNVGPHKESMFLTTIYVISDSERSIPNSFGKIITPCPTHPYTCLIIFFLVGIIKFFIAEKVEKENISIISRN